MHDGNALGPLLGHCFHLVRAQMDARLARYDVTPAQTHVMMHLKHHGGEMLQGNLTQFMRVKPSTVNGILDRMEERGLISRTISGTDARRRVIALTPAGQKQVTLFEHSVQEAERVISAGLSPEELDTLRTLLGRIIRNLEEGQTPC